MFWNKLTKEAKKYIYKSRSKGGSIVEILESTCFFYFFYKYNGDKAIDDFMEDKTHSLYSKFYKVLKDNKFKYGL